MNRFLKGTLVAIAWLMMWGGFIWYELDNKVLAGEAVAMLGLGMLLVVTIVSGSIATYRPRGVLSRAEMPLLFWIVVGGMTLFLAYVLVHFARRLFAI